MSYQGQGEYIYTILIIMIYSRVKQLIDPHSVINNNHTKLPPIF
jgi:hypothetical protein